MSKYKERYVPPDFIPLLQAAVRLQVSFGTAKGLYRAGVLRGDLFSHRICVSIASIEAYEAARAGRARKAANG